MDEVDLGWPWMTLTLDDLDREIAWAKISFTLNYLGLE